MTGDLLRDRLHRRNANSSQLNISTVSNTSAFEDKRSPLCKTRQKNDQLREEKLRIDSLTSKFKWHVLALAVVVFDHFILESSILSIFLFFNPIAVINVQVSRILLVYLVTVLSFIGIEIKFPKASTTVVKAIEGLVNPSTSKPPEPAQTPALKPNDSQAALNTTAEHSWIDAHKFGTPNLNTSNILNSSAFRSSPFNKKSPNSSRIGINPASGTDCSPLLDENTSSIWKSPTAYGKQTESIHTRKQLDVLLKSHENDSPIDVNSTQSSYFSQFWNVFDLSRNSPFHQNNSYQVSEELPEEAANANSSYRMKIGKDGRTEVTMLRRRRANETESTEDENNDDELTKLFKIMNAAKTTPDAKAATGILKRSNSIERGMRGGIRRRSHSSPERSGDFYPAEGDGRSRRGEMLTEEQQKRAEFRVRAWLRNTIILPLAQQIDEINKALDKEHANPPLKIGISSAEALKLAAIERQAIKATNLPFLLPFLSVHSNQAYLVSRIKELSASEFMEVYKWNGGGMEPTEDKLGSSRLVRREWNDSLPTDASLIFELFTVYMDAQLNSNCLVGENRLDQPFSSQYIVKFPKKAISTQRLAYSFYLHMATLSPPHFEFVHNDSNGAPVRCAVARQTSNLFRTIAQFVHYVKEENHGYLDQTSIGPAGINIAIVLN